MGFFSKKESKSKPSETISKDSTVRTTEALKSSPNDVVTQVPIRHVLDTPNSPRPAFPLDDYNFNADHSLSYQACRYRLNMITLE